MMGENSKRKFYLEHFRAISHAISTYEDLELLLNHIVEGLTRTFEIKGACMLVLEEKEQRMYVVAHHGVSEGYLNKGPVFADKKHSAFAKGEPVYIDDMQHDPRVQYPAEAKAEDIKSMMSFPIVFKDTVIGIMRLYHSAHMEIDKEDIESILVIGEHVAIVIENNGLNNFVEMVKLAVNDLPPRLLEK